MLRSYRRFKKHHKGLHTFLVALAVVMFWRGVWGLLDTYFFPNNQFMSYFLSILLALAIIYLDDFHLKELE